MFRQNKNKPLLFYKYLLSYMLIFLIPFTALSVIFYKMSVDSIQDEIVQSNIGKLEQVRNFTDSRMEELKNIGMRISFDDRFTPYMLQQPYKEKEAIKELRTYQMGSSIIDSLFLNYNGEDVLYSSKGTGTIRNFTKNVYPFTHAEAEKFREDLVTATEPSMRPITLHQANEKDEKKLISYLYPISPENDISFGTVMFFIKESMLKTLIENVLGDFQGNAYIFNEDNEMLVSNNKGEVIEPTDVQQFASGNPGVVNESINNKDYSLVTVQSEVSNWTFVTAMPTAQFYSKMSALKVTILIIVSIIALLGAGITIYLSKRQYKPIQRLTQLIKHKQYADGEKKEKKDELENIKDTLEYIFEDSENLRKRVSIHKPLVRDQFLLNLLKDNVKAPAEMNSLLKDIQITFQGDYFFVIMVSFNEKINEKSLQNREDILGLLTEFSCNGNTGHGVELIHDNAVVLIVNMQENTKEQRLHYTDELAKQLNEKSQVMPTMGVGGIYEGLDSINRSFIEAAASIEQNLLSDRRTPILFEEITATESNTFWYPVDKQVQMVQSLKLGDQVVAEEALKNLIQNVKEKNISIYLFRSMCFDIINTILKSISELGLVHNVDEVQQLVEFKTLADLEEKGLVLIADICKAVEKRKVSHHHSLSNNILAYIQKEYTQHDLSLENTAEAFQLSASYLSRFIKEQTGTTFTQYVWELRNEAFKKQLKETTIPIKEIVNQIGYVDVANFTRKFKKEEGLTPGQYRKQAVYDSVNKNAL